MPATKVRFSDKFIESLQAPEQSRAIYYDTESDLALRVTPTRKVFFISGHVRGKSVRKTLGVYGAGRNVEWARKQAARLLGELANWKLSGQQGRSPFDAPEETTRGLKLSEAIELYVAEQRSKKWYKSREPQAAEDQARRWLNGCGALLKKPIDEITHAEVRALHARLSQKNGPVAADRTTDYLASCLAVVLNPGAPNPARGVKRNGTRQVTRFLSPDELNIFLAGLDAHKNREFADLIGFLLATGRRKSVVFEARWSDIDLTRGVWTIPVSMHRRPEVCLLSREAKTILERRYANRVSEWVFPSRLDSTRHVVDNTVKDSWYLFLKKIGLKMRMHDLRHTAISYLVSSTQNLAVAQAASGHRSLSSMMRYTHLLDSAVRDAVQAGEDHRKKLAQQAKAQKLLSA